MNSAAAIADGCPSGPGVVDFVGYGGASCSEGAATIPDLGRAAAVRIAAGCTDTDDNGADFQVAPPQPRNAASAAIGCAQ